MISDENLSIERCKVRKNFTITSTFLCTLTLFNKHNKMSSRCQQASGTLLLLKNYNYLRFIYNILRIICIFAVEMGINAQINQ